MIRPETAVVHLAADDTRPLRHAILRPNQPPSACVYPGDDDPASFHLGIRGADPTATGGHPLIAVASFYREPMPPDWAGSESPAPGIPDLRIRGMAVLLDHRGQGLGRRLIDAGLAIARAQNSPPTRIWCNARTSAAGYYARLGLTPRGDEFEIDGIGPHFVMVRDIAAAPAE